MIAARLWGLAAATFVLAACQSVPLRMTPETNVEPETPTQSPVEVVAPLPDTPEAASFLVAEPEPPASSAEVLERLRQQFSEPVCNEDALTRQWQQRYAGSPQRFAGQIDAILPWLALTLEAVERYKLPGEFALLPIAESWYRPDARGAGDHVGVWQLGRSTAAYLGVPVTSHYDGRMDALLSTDAAIRYLAELQNRFGDWKLATAAYNAGPQRVAQLIEPGATPPYSATARIPKGLPATTFEHIARIRALACLLGEPERHGISFPTADAPFDPLVAIKLPPGQSSLALIAREREVPRELLATLNPAFRQGFVAASAPRNLLLPSSLSEHFQVAFEMPHAATPATPAQTKIGASHHVVQRGDTLGAIARQHGVKLRTLFSLNGLNERSILRPGQRLRLAP